MDLSCVKTINIFVLYACNIKSMTMSAVATLLTVATKIYHPHFMFYGIQYKYIIVERYIVSYFSKMHEKLSLMFKTNNFVKTRYIYIYTLYKNWQLSRTTWEGGG